MGNNPVTVVNPRSVTSTFGLQICILSSILRVLKVHIGDLELDGNGKGSADTLEACESLLGALLKVYMSPMKDCTDLDVALSLEGCGSSFTTMGSKNQVCY
ncbi:hypothetical protein SLEP1_g19332 [Rubroshorea leprosula]|nr:hypothetical protein SLEP1_g19332 [Rubroshorea leprosula]